jgi:hypothetical protein
MQTLSAVTLNLGSLYPKLINALQKYFTENIMLLSRLHFDIENPQSIREITTLIMQERQGNR